MLVSFLDIFL